MKGWMKYRPKAGFVGRITGLREHRYWFVLNEACHLHGYKDEAAAEHGKPDVTLTVLDCAITISQEISNQFEITGDRQQVVLVCDQPDDVLNWVSSIQRQRSIQQGVSPAPNKIMSRTVSKVPRESTTSDNTESTSNNNLASSDSGSLNGQLTFDDPLSATTPTSVADFEWDSEAVCTTSSSPWQQHHDESSALFQLSRELSDAKEELVKCRQRITSYQEVLASRDRQLFEIQDEMVSLDSREMHSQAFRNLEEQARSYREQNALLNEEVLKLHQMCNKSQNEALEQKRKAGKLAVELRKFQRNYTSALGHCVHRPLVDPDDSARMTIPERDRHVKALKGLTQQMKATNDRILGCSIPTLGKVEHIDTFGFIHSLPNEALQVQYICEHLQKAFSVLLETNEDNQNNLKKWKSYIRDSSEQFEVTPQLRRLVLQGIPNQYRAYVWQKLIIYYVSDMKYSAGDSYYEAMLNQCEIMKHDRAFTKNLKQISMDVPRTMPNNRDFISSDSSHRERLHHVLTAFCVHSPRIEYCQGFNFLAGGCLLFLEEEDAFWFLVAVTEKLFPPDYYRNGLAGLLADQYVLQQIIAIKLPRLNDHLSRFPEVDLAAVTTGWFLGLFFDCLPFQTLIHVWDCFLAFGHEAVFRISCAMFKLFELRLLELNEASQLLHAAKNIPRLCSHPAHLIQEAFSGPFPAWEEIEEQRSQIEQEMIEKHEKKMKQRRYYDERIMTLDLCEDAGHDEKWNFDCGAALDKFILSANCRLTQNSQVYEVGLDHIKPLVLPITSRVMCVYIITDDIILVGLFTGQLQAYSISESSLCWSMSLSDVVLCILPYDMIICVGTADGKLHVLQVNDLDSDQFGVKKPTLKDSIELSKRPTTCINLIADQSCLWVASGPAIYVVSIETNETDGFFLISSHIEQVSVMLHWAQFVLIAIRGSPVIQLHTTSPYSSPPLLVYDVGRDIPLSPLYPMMPDDGEPPTSVHITSMVLVDEQTFWAGTSDGTVKMYHLMSEVEDGVDANAKQQPPSTSAQPPSTSTYSLHLIGSKKVSEKPIRCLLKSDAQVVSSSGCYGDEGSIKMWNFVGEFTNIDVPASETSSSDLIDDSKSLASSSRSIDSDSRQARTDGAAEAWKSTMKSVAATALKTYRDKKPRIRKFINMLGTNQS